MTTLEIVKETPDITTWVFRDSGQKIGKGPPLEKRIPVAALIFSDIHTGKNKCHHRALRVANHTFLPRERILLGDIIHEDRPLPDAHLELLGALTDSGDSTHPCQVTFVIGNHDVKDRIRALKDLLRLNMDIVQEHVVWCSGKSYALIHGDRFDTIISRFPRFARVITRIADTAQLIDPHNRHLLRWIDRATGRYRRESDIVAEGALRYTRHHRHDAIICGHVHKAEVRDTGGIIYINSGSWTEEPCSFVTITEKGPMLHFVHIEKTS